MGRYGGNSGAVQFEEGEPDPEPLLELSQQFWVTGLSSHGAMHCMVVTV